jgi:hypothetical protein
MFKTKFVEKLETHILCSVTFIRKSCRLWDNMDKYSREGQVTYGNMAHAQCMLGTEGYRQTDRHTHTGCVILIAFPLQQCFHKHASMLHYACIACLVNVLLTACQVALYGDLFLHSTVILLCNELFLYHDIWCFYILPETLCFDSLPYKFSSTQNHLKLLRGKWICWVMSKDSVYISYEKKFALFWMTKRWNCEGSKSLLIVEIVRNTRTK